MQTQVRTLRDALELLTPVVAKKTVLEITRCVLLKEGMARATNLEVGAAVEMDGIEGEYVLPFSDVLALLKQVPGHQALTIEQEGGHLRLVWGDGSATLDSYEPDDFPPMPTVEERVGATVAGDPLIAALSAMVPYCATQELRPVLTGVGVMLGENIELAGADGFRLAFQTLPMAIPAENGFKHVIIPAHTVKILERLWAKAPRTPPESDSLVELVASQGKIKLSFSGSEGTASLGSAKFGPVSVVFRLIAGTPPNYAQLIPKEPPQVISVFAPDLERAVRLVRRLAETDSGIVRLVWDSEGLKVSASAKDKGSTEATVGILSCTEEGRIALNSRYLLEFLKSKTGLITMGVSTVSSPAILRYRQSPTVVVMPMFVAWDGEPAADEATDEAPEAGEEGEEGAAEQPADFSEEEPTEDAEPPEEHPQDPEPVEATATTEKPKRTREPRKSK